MLTGLILIELLIGSLLWPRMAQRLAAADAAVLLVVFLGMMSAVLAYGASFYSCCVGGMLMKGQLLSNRQLCRYGS